MKEVKYFDMSMPPRKIKWYLKPVKNLLCKPTIKKHKAIINYVGSENLKGPFLLLCNHNAFLDFKVANTCLGKNDANYVVAIDGFLKREGLLRNVGCICKRKFTNDITLVKQLKRVISERRVAVVYPEARYSLCGTTAILPSSLGKLAKLLNVNVATLICHGHHINSPFWDTSHERGVEGIESTYKLLIKKEELDKLSVDEINNKILDEFQYDDFKWQKEKGILVKDEKRAEGLHRVLYQCPVCKTEYEMSSNGKTLKCNHCNSTWEMKENGELELIAGDNKSDINFNHIPDWYEWQRSNVRREIEEGTYSTGILKCQVDSLPKDRFYDLGEATLIHDMNGFNVTLNGDLDGKSEEVKYLINKTRSMVIPAEALYSCHIEYQYLFKKGDCVDLNTINDTWYIFPFENQKFNVTKIALATEELYLYKKRESGVEIKKGFS